MQRELNDPSPDQQPPTGEVSSSLKPRHWLGFFALCLLWSSAWLVEGAWPSTLPIAVRQCFDDLFLAAVLGLIGWKSFTPRYSARPLRTRRATLLALASVCLLGLPAVLIETTA